VSSADGSVGAVHTIVDHGPNSQRYNIVLLGDGYQASELAKFAADAETFIGTLRSTVPYTKLWSAINVHRVDVVSTESGADDPATCGDGSIGAGVTRKTYFDSTFCGGGNIRRLLTCDSASAKSVAKAQVPEMHMTMVIVNTSEYGGSGGDIATFSTAPGAAEIGLHEMGHTAFGLADEYSTYAGCSSGETGHDHYAGSEPSQPNITANANAASIKWKTLLTNAADALPTTANPDCTKCDTQANLKAATYVGAYEGAGYFHCGLYRPQFTCRMRDLGNPFCAVCQAAIVQTISPFQPPPEPPTQATTSRSSLLIPSAVALLAHKRLRDVVEALERKAGGGFYDALSFAGSSEPVVFTDTERRVLALAKAARAMFEAGPAVDASASLPVGQGFGRFAIAGSAAFQLPAYAELWQRNGSWVADTLRRGTPDENMSKVVVGSSQVSVRTGELAVGLVADDAAQARIQSFSMGMLSAVASSVVVDPVLRGLQARRGKLDWNQGLPQVDVAAAERRIVQTLLGGPSGGAAWQGWWPKPDDVPDALLDGYLKAIDEAFSLSTNRPKGFADFEQRFAAATPPALTRARLRDGYSLLQLDVSLTPWGAGTWYVALLPMLVVPVVGFALVRALPHGKAFVDPSVHVDERAAWELLTLATGLGALAPAGYSIYLWTQIPENTEAFVEAVVLFGLRAALALGSIAAAGAGAGVRWGLLYAPLALTDVYGLIRGLIEKSRGGPAGFVFLLQTLPVLTGATVLLFALIADALISAGVDHDVAYFVVLAAMAALLLAGLGIPLAVALSHSGGLRSIIGLDRPQVADSLTALTENGGPAALATLFDDSTLWFDPTVNAPTLADLRYPAGRRALLRVWWTGDGDLQINHDDNSVVFKRGDGSTKQVDLPPGKTSAADLAALLVAQMPGIQAEPFVGADPEYDLPWPHTLADPGDTQLTLAAHDLHAHDFAPLGKTRDAAYPLPHTPRVELTTTYGVAGPSRSQLDAIPLVPAQMLGDLEQSALGTAADLAVLLCIGAAPSLAGSAAPSAAGGASAEVPGPLTAFTPAGAAPLPGHLGPVFQVFRQWNLDERRVNEWRQLVQGGAVSDQPDPMHADPGMRPDPRVGAPAYTSLAQSAPPAAPALAPELVARALGWVPLWRAWSRIAADVTADASASSPMHYTPAVSLGDGTDLQPTNVDLTNGIRLLLDLP
jgi:hypothetical protein